MVASLSGSVILSNTAEPVFFKVSMKPSLVAFITPSSPTVCKLVFTSPGVVVVVSTPAVAPSVNVSPAASVLLVPAAASAAAAASVPAEYPPKAPPSPPYNAPVPTSCPVTAADTAPKAAPAIAEPTTVPIILLPTAVAIAEDSPIELATIGAAKGIATIATTDISFPIPPLCTVG